MEKTLSEYQAAGGCEGCYFYTLIEAGRKECTFHWFDDGSVDWEIGKNCDEIKE